MNKKTIIYGSIAIILALIYRFLPAYFYYQGKANYDNENYSKSYEYLNKAYSVYKNNSDFRNYYVKAMLKNKPDKNIQKKLFEISTDSNNDNAHENAANQIRRWKFNVLRNIGNNYIEQVPLDKKIIRWSKLPITISIENKSSTQVPDYYKNEILRAFSQWQNSTRFLKFKQVNSSDANISIEIKDLPDNVCEGNVCHFVLGYTTPQYSGKFLKKMNIILYNKNPRGEYFSDKSLYNTVLHEIGHALGIMGHSYNENDLMYMTAEQDNTYAEDRSSFQYLSQQDVNTITLLYKLIPDITNSEKINYDGLVYAPIVLGTDEDISKRKLKEAQNYIKNAPDLAGGYIDLGIAYSELGRYNEAIDAMQKAYSLSKTDNERYMSLFNLSAIYLSMENKTKAKEYALKAQQISNTEEVQNLILNIR